MGLESGAAKRRRDRDNDESSRKNFSSFVDYDVVIHPYLAARNDRALIKMPHLGNSSAAHDLDSM